MSYNSPETPPSRPSGPRWRGPVVVAVVTAVPAALAGWLVWQSTGGGDGGQRAARSPESSVGAPVRPSPSDAARSTEPEPSRDPGRPSGKPSGKPDGDLAGKTVVIDPGHNPSNYRYTARINRQVSIGTTSKECDTTGTSTDSGYPEGKFTLDVSRRVRALLRAQGVTVKLTQDGDRAWGPCVDERARIGNEAHADAAISIHADGAPPGDRGFHVILPAAVHAGGADTRPITAASRDLGERVAGRFVHATGSAPSNYIGGGTGLDVRGDLGGLNLSTVPKVFIECANMRDAKDAALVTDSGWRQKAAQGIAEGIVSFLRR